MSPDSLPTDPAALPSQPAIASLAPHQALPQGAARLDDWGVIRAMGDEARKFLHSQLTQDIDSLGADQARLAGYCSPKGRLLASFVVWQRAPDDVLLACSADLLQTMLKRLQMFVMRAKCKLSDASVELPVWGLAGATAQQVLGAEAPAAVWGRSATAAGDVVRLPDAVVDGQAVPRYLQVGSAPALLPSLDLQAWRWLEAMSGVARISAATAEQFVPQMVNLEAVGGVSFQKGCFPGQEIVARSQYRSTLKRRGYVLSSTAPVLPGQEIFHSADPTQPAGMVVLAGSWGDRHAVLAELKIAAVASDTEPLDGALHAGSSDGVVLTPLALPYTLPPQT